jgi:PAS domain S-box-containing protein
MLMTGRKQVKGLFERVDNLTKTVETIAEQFKPNGGSSLYDRIEGIRAYQWNFAETLVDKPVWETDDRGGCVKANSAYLRLTERPLSELTGAGWENIIHPEDRAKVFEDWQDAIARKRAYEGHFRVRSKSGKVFMVKAFASPIETASGRLVAYVGRYDDVHLVP